MTIRLAPCRVEGCDRQHGVVITSRRTSRPAVHLAADSASGEWRERGVPGERPGETPDGRLTPVAATPPAVMPLASPRPVARALRVEG